LSQLCICYSMAIRLAVSFLRRRKWSVALLATIVAVAVFGWLSQLNIYSTDAGEWMTSTIRDGSVGQLGPRTTAVARIDGESRDIWQPKGEAFYSVAKDPKRPFIVRSGIASVRAVGTQFAVSKERRGVKVTVAEGIVDVSRHPPVWDLFSAPDTVRVRAGQQVWVDERAPLVVSPVDVHAELAWERGRVVFSGEPVELAIGAFNRRHRRQIPVPNHSGANLRIFGEFDLKDPDKFAQYLEKLLAPQEQSKTPR